jgi:L-malate glycosyltransferase
MRILYFTRDYSPHDHRFLSALAETEHEVFLLRLERRNALVDDRPVPQNIRQIVWKGGYEPFRWRNAFSMRKDLQRVIREVKPDLIHAGPVQTTAFLAAWSRFRPLVTMSWGTDLLQDADSSSTLRWLTRYTLRHSSVLVGDCQAVADKAALMGYPPQRTVVFPWGVDLKVFSPAKKTGSYYPVGQNSSFILLSLRSWEPLYGVDVIVKAFALAARQAPGLHLVLLGSGSQAGLINRLIIDNDIHDKVTIGGQVSNVDLPQYYRDADLYLSASHSDGSSVSLMEALACGLPVLVSNIPGNREWIAPGEQGWLFPDGDVNALAEGILRAMRLRDELKIMGSNARLIAEQRADWKQNFQQLLVAYEMACNG